MLSSYEFVDISSYGIPASQSNLRQRTGDARKRLCPIDVADAYETVRERMDAVRVFASDTQAIGDEHLSTPFAKPYMNNMLGRMTKTGTSTILKMQNLWDAVYSALYRWYLWKGEDYPLTDASASSLGSYWWKSIWPTAFRDFEDERYAVEIDGEQTTMVGGIPNASGAPSFGSGYAALSTDVLERIYSAVDELDYICFSVGIGYMKMKAGSVYGGRTLTEDESLSVVYSAIDDGAESSWTTEDAEIVLANDWSSIDAKVTGMVCCVLFEASAYDSSAIKSHTYYGSAFDMTRVSDGWKFPGGTFTKAGIARMIPSVPSGGTVDVTARGYLAIPQVSWRASLKV